MQMFEPLFIRIGEPLFNDTMFELSRYIEAVEGCKVLKAVSFVHDCFSEGCHFEEMVTTVPIEREKVGVLTKKYLFTIIQIICIVLIIIV